MSARHGYEWRPSPPVALLLLLAFGAVVYITLSLPGVRAYFAKPAADATLGDVAWLIFLFLCFRPSARCRRECD